MKEQNGKKSGRLNLKVPVTLHSELALLAERERVSLNYLVGTLLASEVTRLRATRTTIAATKYSAMLPFTDESIIGDNYYLRTGRSLVADVKAGTVVPDFPAPSKETQSSMS